MHSLPTFMLYVIAYLPWIAVVLGILVCVVIGLLWNLWKSRRGIEL